MVPQLSPEWERTKKPASPGISATKGDVDRIVEIPGGEKREKVKAKNTKAIFVLYLYQGPSSPLLDVYCLVLCTLPSITMISAKAPSEWEILK